MKSAVAGDASFAGTELLLPCFGRTDCGAFWPDTRGLSALIAFATFFAGHGPRAVVDAQARFRLELSKKATKFPRNSDSLGCSVTKD